MNNNQHTGMYWSFNYGDAPYNHLLALNCWGYHPFIWFKNEDEGFDVMEKFRAFDEVECKAKGRDYIKSLIEGLDVLLQESDEEFKEYKQKYFPSANPALAVISQMARDAGYLKEGQGFAIREEN